MTNQHATENEVEQQTSPAPSQCADALDMNSTEKPEIKVSSKGSLLDQISTSPAVQSYLRVIGTEEKCLALYKVNTSLTRMATTFQNEQASPFAAEWHQRPN